MKRSSTNLPLFDHRPAAVNAAVEALAEARADERGSVFTRREVVDFILDVAGYTDGEDLSTRRILEPSFGAGEFVAATTERLLASYSAHGGTPKDAPQRLEQALVGVELHRPSFDVTRERVSKLLRDYGIDASGVEHLCDAWLTQDDFLLARLNGNFTDVVGNPPYLRQEAIPNALLEEYRRRYSTIYDRADLYVPFIERSLTLLRPGGSLVFICSDRWMKNRYGGPLRDFVGKRYHLSAYVDMVGVSAFEGDVVAYPAIFRIANSEGAYTAIARRPSLDPHKLRHLACELDPQLQNGGADTDDVQLVTGIVQDSNPWLLDSPAEVAILRRLEDAYPLLEETGSSVGIGVATGADRVFIRPMEELDVEEPRRLPIVKTDDIRSGVIEWKGLAVLNPYDESGNLVPLEQYPRFADYLHENLDAIKSRHTAKKNPTRWYKTIDRIYPHLTSTPKLLIPDIKGAASVVYDAGDFYPHHNLYHVTAEQWDLRALQAVLRSAVAEFFVAMYAVKMRGGYLRYQAQYLRRIRIPRWEDVSPSLREQLKSAAEGDRTRCDEIVFNLYGLSENERQLVKASVYEAERASS